MSFAIKLQEAVPDLGEHLFSILGSSYPELKLQEEAKQYTAWMVQAKLNLDKLYGEADAHPTERSWVIWTQDDLDYLRLERRQDFLSGLLMAVEIEETLRLPESVPKLLKFMQDLLTLADPEPHPIDAVVPTEMRLFSKPLPLWAQHAYVEAKRLRELLVVADGVNIEICTYRGKVFETLCLHWVLDHLPRHLLGQPTKYAPLVEFGWNVVVTKDMR